jgi:flagellar biosynthesis anti-sigma factor FlgM
LADLDQHVRNLPDVNEERVSQLRSAIEQGTYQVRPQHIADQLMSLERSLGSLPDGE